MTFWPETRLVSVRSKDRVHPYYHLLPLPLNIDEEMVSGSLYSNLALRFSILSRNDFIRKKFYWHFIFIKSNNSFIIRIPTFGILDIFISLCGLLSYFSTSRTFHAFYKATFVLRQNKFLLLFLFTNNDILRSLIHYFQRLLLSQSYSDKVGEESTSTEVQFIPLTSLSLVLTRLIPFWK